MFLRCSTQFYPEDTEMLDNIPRYTRLSQTNLEKLFLFLILCFSFTQKLQAGLNSVSVLTMLQTKALVSRGNACLRAGELTET